MGNPHAVTIVPDVIAADVARIGPQVEAHERFPARVNAGFMQTLMKNMRVCVCLNVGSARLWLVVQVPVPQQLFRVCAVVCFKQG